MNLTPQVTQDEVLVIDFCQNSALLAERLLNSLPVDQAVPVAEAIQDGAGIEVRCLARVGHRPRIQVWIHHDDAVTLLREAGGAKL